MSRKSLYKSSKTVGASHRRYPTARAYSMLKGGARDDGADRRDRPAKFFSSSEPILKRVIDFAKLPIIIRLEGGGFRFRCGVWAGILMLLPSRAVEDIRITTELPGPRLLQALLAKAAGRVEITRRGSESTPQHIIVDNGAEFRSRVVAQFVQNSGLKLIHVPPYRKPSKGAVERFFSALNREVLKKLPGYDAGQKRSESTSKDDTGRLLTLPQLQAAVDEWMASYKLSGR